jgi:hypothetical protein
MRQSSSFSQTINVIAVVLATVVLATVFHGFDGTVQIELGINGGKVTVTGHKALPENKNN